MHDAIRRYPSSTIRRGVFPLGDEAADSLKLERNLWPAPTAPRSAADLHRSRCHAALGSTPTTGSWEATMDSRKIDEVAATIDDAQTDVEELQFRS
jgi:hypothetical protein